jgi:periplasmic protein TonB
MQADLFPHEDLSGDRFFYTAITASCILHLVAIAYLTVLNNHYAWMQTPTQIEISYKQIVRKTTPEPQMEVLSRQDKTGSAKPSLPKDNDFFSAMKNLTAMVKPEVKDVSRISDDVGTLNKKTVPKIEPLDMERKISVPLLTGEKISNPQYLTYNQSIRQKIMQRAYRYIDNPHFQSGGVYLTFILARTGELREINIIENKTNANDYLRQVAIRSVREASPFAPFPQDLRYPELTFNVIISFELRD